MQEIRHSRELRRFAKQHFTGLQDLDSRTYNPKLRSFPFLMKWLLVLFATLSLASTNVAIAADECAGEVEQGQGPLVAGETYGRYTVPQGTNGTFAFIGTIEVCRGGIDDFRISKDISYEYTIFPGVPVTVHLFIQATESGIFMFVTINGVTEFLSMDSNGDNCDGSLCDGVSDDIFLSEVIRDMEDSIFQNNCSFCQSPTLMWW